MVLNTVVWSGSGELEPDWTQVVAKDLTYEQAVKVAKRHMLLNYEKEVTEEELGDVWYTSVTEASGLSGKVYRVELQEMK